MKYAMIEINGGCPNSCPMCLPKEHKTRTHLGIDDVCLLADNLMAVGVTNITLAGFGNPVDHPNYSKVVDVFVSRIPGCSLTVTCRVGDIFKASGVSLVHASVDTVEDAKALVGLMRQHLDKYIFLPRIAPHVVITDHNASSIGTILKTLEPCAAGIDRISFACPVVLAPHPGHIAAIRKANGPRSRRAWGSLKAFVLRQGSKSPWYDKIVLHGPDRVQTEHCQWPSSGVYIDARLDVRPCCYNPLSQKFGNIKKQPLWRIREKMKWFCDGGWESLGMCRHCPDIGAGG